ncbi:MAG: hypothetical protein ACFB5Z_00045 [Elainellaceae cyanobacterium]
MSLNPQSENSLTAFITALAEQDDALPEGLQKQLHAIGQNLENRAVELPVIAASLPKLNQAYQAALTSGSESDQGATLVSSTDQSPSDKLLERAAEIFTDPNPVQAAQRHPAQSSGQFAANPLKRLFGRG